MRQQQSTGAVGLAGPDAAIGGQAGFQRIFEAAPIAMLICSLNGMFIHANTAFYKLMEYDPGAVIVNICELVHPEAVESERQFIQDMGNQVLPEVSKIRYRKGNGAVIDVERHAAIVHDTDICIMQIIDMTTQKQLETRMRFMALHDPLTGLGNRLQFQERLADALQQAAEEGTGAAIVFIDLDQFKLINDTIGHQAGDQALQEIGRRIAGCVRKNDTVARLGGDEFVVLLPTVGNRLLAEAIAKKMIRAIKEPLLLAGRPFILQASAGAAVFPADGQDADRLLAAADAAMYRCKHRQPGSHPNKATPLHHQ